MRCSFLVQPEPNRSAWFRGDGARGGQPGPPYGPGRRQTSVHQNLIQSQRTLCEHGPQAGARSVVIGPNSQRIFAAADT